MNCCWQHSWTARRSWTQGWSTVFQVGDQIMLQTKELLDVADTGNLLPLWVGPL
jgi:hypothetical protein